MSAVGEKEVLYIYNGNDTTTEVEFDADGSVPEPTAGSMIKRNGKEWKVASASIQAQGMAPGMMPVLKINLTDQS